MIVLSLFDGISCAYEALRRAGIEIKTYYAAEIEKNAIKISQKNHPDIIQLGDVKTIAGLPQIDLLIGGSPCQDLSIAKRDRKGLEGDRSGLFWEYARLKRELNPTYFILENVASMPKKDRDIITKELGVEPVMFNASLVSAQSRKRYFWTNIKFELPEDRGIILKDILQPETEIDDRFVIKPKSFITILPKPKEHEFIQVGYFGSPTQNNVGGQALRVYTDQGKSTTSGVGLYKIGYIDDKTSQGYKVYDTQGKSVTLTSAGGGIGAGTGLYIVPEATKQGYAIAQEGDSIDLSYPNSTTRRGRVGQKAKNIMTQSTIGVVANNQIRRLTPIECERLQGLPDNYTEGIPMTHRYKVLGNAFNVDVVAHILSYINP